MHFVKAQICNVVTFTKFWNFFLWKTLNLPWVANVPCDVAMSHVSVCGHSGGAVKEKIIQTPSEGQGPLFIQDTCGLICHSTLPPQLSDIFWLLNHYLIRISFNIIGWNEYIKLFDWNRLNKTSIFWIWIVDNESKLYWYKSCVSMQNKWEHFYQLKEQDRFKEIFFRCLFSYTANQLLK